MNIIIDNKLIYGYSLTQEEITFLTEEEYKVDDFETFKASDGSVYFGVVENEPISTSTKWFSDVEAFALDGGLIEAKVAKFGPAPIRKPQWFLATHIRTGARIK